MQFKIPLAKPDPRLILDIDAAILDIDPAAVIGLNLTRSHLRVASTLDAKSLCALLAAVGHPVEHAQLEPVPSECCGGCGG